MSRRQGPTWLRILQYSTVVSNGICLDTLCRISSARKREPFPVAHRGKAVDGARGQSRESVFLCCEDVVLSDDGRLLPAYNHQRQWQRQHQRQRQ